MKYLFPLLLLLSFKTYAQFDTLIFRKEGIYFKYNTKNVISLGDQNGDKCDDFLAYDCLNEKVCIYFGGNPVDTTPRLTFNVKIRDMVSLDINNDGVKDIVLTTFQNNYEDTGRVEIYYGGALLDTIPDIVFHSPKGILLVRMLVVNDFNGDGRSELVFYDPNVPSSNYKQNGNFYFFNTEAEFDTIAHYVIRGDTNKTERLHGNWFSTGDINGDGKADMAIYGYLGKVGEPSFNPFRKIILGNSKFDFTSAVTYYQNEHKFDVNSWSIIKDVNSDGKDDFIISDYGFYEDEVGYGILYGSFPIDTIPRLPISGQNQAIDIFNIVSGKFNGDSYNDFYTRISPGGYGQVKIWLGGHEMKQYSEETWGGGEDGFCRGIAEVGDVNGDGMDDICLLAMHFVCDGTKEDCECTKGGMYILKGVKDFKNDTTTAVINSIKRTPPEDYFLNEPYPNPFNPETVISYRIKEKSRVEIDVYDITGKFITKLLDEEKPLGSYSVKFEAGKLGLSSGVYLVQMRAFKGNNIVFSAGRKLSFIK